MLERDKRLQIQKARAVRPLLRNPSFDYSAAFTVFAFVFAGDAAVPSQAGAFDLCRDASNTTVSITSPCTVSAIYRRADVNLLTANAFQGGFATFRDGSVLNAIAAGSISGTSLTFFDDSSLRAFRYGVDRSGKDDGKPETKLYFRQTSLFEALGEGAFSAGAAVFEDESTMAARWANSVAGGTMVFHRNSQMIVDASSAVAGGEQSFFDNSRMTVTSSSGVMGGKQSFYDTSSLRLEASAAYGPRPELEFNDRSSLYASATRALAGTTVHLRDDSQFIANKASAGSGATIVMHDQSSVQVRADKALNGASLQFLGGGKLTLNGHNAEVGLLDSDYDGVIQPGGVIENGGSKDAMLTISTPGSAAYRGEIRDGGSGKLGLRKIGAGYMLINGPMSVGGDIVVDEGSLHIAAGSEFMTDRLTIGADGAFAGEGVFYDLIVKGRIRPLGGRENKIIAGTLRFSGTYELYTSDTGSAVISAGAAYLDGGKVHHVSNGGRPVSPSSTFTILTAGTIIGRFEGVVHDFAFLNATLAYAPSAPFQTATVTLKYERNSVSFADIGENDNQDAVGTAAHRLGAGHAVHDALLGLDADSAQGAFDALTGDVHASAQAVSIEDSRFVRNAAMGRVRDAFAGHAGEAFSGQFAGWGHAFGSWGGSDGSGEGGSVSRSASGVVTGIDGLLLDGWRVGFLTGYSSSSLSVREHASSGKISSAHVGVYGGTQWAALALRGGAAYSWNDIETERRVVFPAFNEELKAEYDSGTAQVFGEVGYRLDGPLSLEPFAGLAHVSLDTGSRQEAGGASALSGRDGETDVTFSTLGVRGSFGFALGTLKAEARGLVGWRHAFGDTTPVVWNALAGVAAFAIEGAQIAEDAALVEAGFDVVVGEGADLSLLYAGQIADDAQDHGVKATLNVRF